MNIILNWKERNLICHFCGEARSVKYEIENFDPVIDSKPNNICICNMCALRYALNEKEKCLYKQKPYM